jgi:hypothetical protein
MPRRERKRRSTAQTKKAASARAAKLESLMKTALEQPGTKELLELYRVSESYARTGMEAVALQFPAAEHGFSASHASAH